MENQRLKGDHEKNKVTCRCQWRCSNITHSFSVDESDGNALSESWWVDTFIQKVNETTHVWTEYILYYEEKNNTVWRKQLILKGVKKQSFCRYSFWNTILRGNQKKPRLYILSRSCVKTYRSWRGSFKWNSPQSGMSISANVLYCHLPSTSNTILWLWQNIISKYLLRY